MTMKKKLPKHGHTILTRPRWFTEDTERADNSFFVWGWYKDKVYSLSLLGIINGLLNKFGIVMYCDIDMTTKGILKWHIKKKWW